ncbi:hypothetical protein B9L20_01050 [Serratia marcescens]|uniref:hypothetical protein n=1 Tax=Serratia TaxID=613 RepID=UPI000A26BACE|nr:hypothetical protein [Serratia marcescens]MDM1788444.1 hypothetical protein [Serratia marcescens]MDM1794920.1 hypothetical protein [Serratia marcescens]MDM1802646.1 hypothetical protein [Serratia marcescens]MDM1804755.1 hypothetical protein [Serratia marcescens]MDM1811788.1 hypothetical protein [Serratia marcescens]
MDLSEVIKRQSIRHAELKSVGTGWHKPAAKPPRRNIDKEVAKAKADAFNQSIAALRGEIRSMRAAGIKDGQLRKLYAAITRIELLRDSVA